MKDKETIIRDEARRLLEEGKVNVVIGHGAGMTPYASTPVFIEKPGDVDKLVWNPFCTNNLAVFVQKLLKSQLKAKNKKLVKPLTVAVVVKGCDSRSMVMHLKENQVPRENVVIIGVPCSGMIDRRKLEQAVGERDIVGVEVSGDKVTVSLDDSGTLSLDKRSLIFDDCRTCRYPNPLIHDILAGEKVETPQEDLFADVRKIEEMTSEERWALFTEEMKKCTRCYACRSACPLCYCEECFADQTRPRWIGITDDLPDAMFYQMGRIFHMAGRCIDCGACEAACPNGVRLRLFTKKLVKDAQELFGYIAGLTVDEEPPLATFKADDPNEFVM